MFMSWHPLTTQLIIPLVPLAGFAGTGVTDTTQAKDKLMVLESQTASHTGTGIGPPIRGTHWNEAVRTTTGKTCRRTGEAGREVTTRMRDDMASIFTKVLRSQNKVGL